MMLLITGGSGSGKSAYGEERICSMPGKKRIYVATMIPWDEECRKKIQKHRLQRSEKNFETVEKYRDIQELVLPPHSAVLLECLSNLAANEMFRDEGIWGDSADNLAEKLVLGVRRLKEQADSLVVITNEVFSDGNRYDETTETYIQALGKANCLLAAMADEVAEVVWGIPVKRKVSGDPPDTGTEGRNAGWIC